MSKILIIGSSYSIKDTFSKKFNSETLTFLNFRDAWLKKEVSMYDMIIVSGFHHNKVKESFIDFKKYIIEYFNFILFLESRSSKLILISTYIPSKLSFSRVAFFYKNLLSLVLDNAKVQIISFKKILHGNNKNFFLLKFINFLGIKFTEQQDIIENTEKFFLKKIPNPTFINLKIRRNMLIERFLRIFDYD